VTIRFGVGLGLCREGCVWVHGEAVNQLSEPLADSAGFCAGSGLSEIGISPSLGTPTGDIEYRK